MLVYQVIDLGIGARLLQAFADRERNQRISNLLESDNENLQGRIILVWLFGTAMSTRTWAESADEMANKWIINNFNK